MSSGPEWMRSATKLTDALLASAIDRDPQHLILLSVREVAALMGVSRSSVYRLFAKGTLPSITVGGLRRIRLTDLESFVYRR